MEKNKNESKNFDTPKNRKILRIICSILVAVAIWAYVDEEKTVNVKMSVHDLPVEFANEDTTLADKDLMLISGYETTVDLVLKGPRKVLWKLNKDEIRVVADTALIQDTGVHTLNYELVFPDTVQHNLVQVESASVYAITVTVGDLYKKEVPIQCEVTGRVASGYVAKEMTLDPVNLVLRGQRDDLLDVSYAKIRVNINGIKETMITTVEYQLYDHNDIPIANDGIRASSRLVQVTLPVKAVKDVPLRLNFVEAIGSTMAQVEYTLSRDTVRLEGDDAILADIDNIVLDTIYLQDLEESQTLEYSISVPEGTQIVDGDAEVTVEITMTGVSERSVSATEFVCNNVPAGLTATVTTETLSVMLRGLTEELDVLTGEDLRITANLSNITEPGTYTVPVSIQINGYQNVGVKGSYQVIISVELAEEETEDPEDPETPEAQSLDDPELSEDENIAVAQVVDETQTVDATQTVDESQKSA